MSGSLESDSGYCLELITHSFQPLADFRTMRLRRNVIRVMHLRISTQNMAHAGPDLAGQQLSKTLGYIWYSKKSSLWNKPPSISLTAEAGSPPPPHDSPQIFPNIFGLIQCTVQCRGVERQQYPSNRKIPTLVCLRGTSLIGFPLLSGMSGWQAGNDCGYKDLVQHRYLWIAKNQMYFYKDAP